MKDAIKKDGKLDAELAKSIVEQLETKVDSKAELSEIDPDTLIKQAPLVSIAESLYHLERTAKAMLYIQNCNVDENMPYKRENFFAILGGPDPEIANQEEIDRVHKLSAEEKKS